MDVLVVGAGAVGQVYALCLQRGGARVSFLVRERHAAALREGTTLYPLHDRHRREAVTMRADAVLTTLEEVRAREWDQVFLCVPATAIDDDFMGPLATATRGATIVALPPGVAALACVGRHVPSPRVVPALIGMIAYEAPLEGEEVPTPGIAFFLSRFSPSAFGGPRARAVVEALRKGGCPALVQPRVGVSQAFGSAFLMPNVVALEGAGWSLAALRHGRMLELAARGAREAMVVVAKTLDTSAPFFRFLVRAWILRLIWALAPRFVPLDLETYLAHHFGKVRPQTRALLLGYVRDARTHGVEVPALAELATIIARDPE